MNLDIFSVFFNLLLLYVDEILILHSSYYLYVYLYFRFILSVFCSFFLSIKLWLLKGLWRLHYETILLKYTVRQSYCKSMSQNKVSVVR